MSGGMTVLTIWAWGAALLVLPVLAAGVIAAKKSASDGVDLLLLLVCAVTGTALVAGLWPLAVFVGGIWAAVSAPDIARDIRADRADARREAALAEHRRCRWRAARARLDADNAEREGMNHTAGLQREIAAHYQRMADEALPTDSPRRLGSTE